VAQIDRDALRKQIAARRLAPIYLFVGEDVRLVERMIDAVEATIEAADRPFAVERLYAGEPTASPLEIAAAARVLPMLGDRRLVFVLRAERLLKPKRATKASDVESDDGADADEGGVDFAPLEEYIVSPSASSTVIFVATEIDRTRRFTKRLLEHAQVVVFGGLGGDLPGQREGRARAAELVRSECLRAGRSIEPAAVDLLVTRAGGDITKLRGDLERLMLYTEGQPRISAAAVQEIASVQEATDEWGLVNAIADGDVRRALREVARRLDRGDSPHAVVGQLRWWVSTRLVDGAPDRVRPAIDALFKTDEALKTSGGDERMLVERLVVALTGAPVRSR
jgi:DNA polymerase-3 subunit delta